MRVNIFMSYEKRKGQERKGLVCVRGIWERRSKGCGTEGARTFERCLYFFKILKRLDWTCVVSPLSVLLWKGSGESGGLYWADWCGCLKRFERSTRAIPVV